MTVYSIVLYKYNAVYKICTGKSSSFVEFPDILLPFKHLFHNNPLTYMHTDVYYRPWEIQSAQP
jgi:predicted methyltransferase